MHATLHMCEFVCECMSNGFISATFLWRKSGKSVNMCSSHYKPKVKLYELEVTFRRQMLFVAYAAFKWVYCFINYVVDSSKSGVLR